MTFKGVTDMKSITEVDKNLAVKDVIEKDGVAFYRMPQAPFSLHGVYYDNGMFRRIPTDVAERTSEGVTVLHTHTSGGRIRFCTDSPFVAIQTRQSVISRMPHFPLTGTGGLDIYTRTNGGDYRFAGMFVPPYQTEDGFESRIELGDAVMREITINFPLYSNVDELLIGLKQDARVEAPPAYTHPETIVYYGSSITQGGCASRPGNAYTHRISRALDCDFINLGFSGCAKGETAIVEHMATMDMDMFVLDYDHNAPSKEHLRATHKPIYEAIRKTHPDIPILMLSTTTMSRFFDDRDERRRIIYDTYETARKNGDNNVYFMNGLDIMEVEVSDGTIEGCHPNDLGFYFMANAIGAKIKEIMKW